MNSLPLEDTAPDREHEVTNVAVALIFRRGAHDTFEFLATLREPDAPRANLWEFPGGKFEDDEGVHDAIRRELREELDLVLEDGIPFGTAADDDATQVRERHVRLHGLAFAVDGVSLSPRPLAAQAVRWVAVDRFDDFQWPPASRRLFRIFMEWLERERAHPPI